MPFDTSTSSALLDAAQTTAQAAQMQSKLSAAQNNRAAREAAEEFEAVFLTTMFESMFAGIKTDGPFGGGHGETMFRSMLHQEYAKNIAKNGGIGIADNLYSEIIKLQEQQTAEVPHAPGRE